jgi:hypothetical protein
MRKRNALRAAAFSMVIWLSIAGVFHAQNTNQVMGQFFFEGKTKIDKSSGVWIDGQYVGFTHASQAHLGGTEETGLDHGL